MKSRNGDFELGSHLNIDGTHIVDDPLEPLVDAERQLVPLPRRLLLGVLVLPRRRANVLLKRGTVTNACVITYQGPSINDVRSVGQGR